MSTPLYLDYAATTPLDPQVAQLMCECLSSQDAFGNAASSTHGFGRAAEARIEHARSQVAALIGAESVEIIFTSGATEANNLAILGAARALAHRGRHLITARTEHKAVLDVFRALQREGFEVSYLAPQRNGVVGVAELQALLREDTVLVSLMQVNNETGVVSDIAALAGACAARGIAFHCDAAQGAGQLPIDVAHLPVDFLSFTAHKIYGPKGVGALYVRGASRAKLQAVSFGGSQERGLRPGTLPTHQIAGFGLACELARARLDCEQLRMRALGEHLWLQLRTLAGAHLNAQSAPRVGHILNVSFEGVEGESLVSALGELALSQGSACTSTSGEPSYVLRALGCSAQLAQSSLRFSFGRGTTQADIERAALAVRCAVVKLRERSPANAFDLAQEGDWVCGEAGSPAKEAWVRFELNIEGEVVKAARARVYGCPHTQAAADWLSQSLPGRLRGALVPGDPQAWARTLEVPVEKLGRLLLIEDALRDCLNHWPNARPI